MTSMKKFIAILAMTLMVGCAMFAEAHKKQKVVWCSGGVMSMDRLSVAGGKASIKDAKVPGVVIPDGWHVEHIEVMPANIAGGDYTIILVLEEN